MTEDCDTIRFLTITNGRLFVICDDDADLSGAKLANGGPFRREAGFDAAGFNMLINAPLTKPASEWELAPSIAKTCRMEARPVKLPRGRPARALEVMMEKPREQSRFFIPYKDCHWGDKLPVAPNRRYRLSAWAQAANAVISLKMSFFDAEGSAIRECETNRASPPARAEDDNWVRIASDVVAPPGAATARIAVKLANFGARPQMGSAALIAEPFFGEAPHAEEGRQTRLAHLEALRPLWQSRDAPVYSAALDAPGPPYGNRFEILRPGRDAVSISAPHDCSAAGSVCEFDAARRVISFDVGGDAGDVALFIDGANASSEASYIDGRVLFFLDSDHFDGALHEFAIGDTLGLHFIAKTRVFCPYATYDEFPMPNSPDEGHEKMPLIQRIRERTYSLASDRASNAGDLWLARHLDRLSRAIQAGPDENTERFPLAFDRPASPIVSVIIPAHNKYAHTFHCLCALRIAPNNAPFEVIVVDDGSSDETSAALAEHSGATIVRHEEARGFIGACRAGAAAARGDYLLFLNNDTEPTAGWIDEMLAAFENFPQAGAAGAKLIFPEGRLQDAGGVVWRSGDPFNYGRQKNPVDPRYNYAREVDYVSGAALMTPRRVWEEIGGFCRDLEPAYFEDTWYAFELRERGLRAIYTPQAEVFHIQGATYGKDAAAPGSMKAHLEINRPKFKRRWARAFRKHGRYDKYGETEKDRYADADILAVATDAAIDDRTLAFLRAASYLKAKITLVSLDGRAGDSMRRALQRVGVEFAIAPFYPTADAAFDAFGAKADAVVFADLQAAISAGERLGAFAPNAKSILFPVDPGGHLSNRSPSSALYPCEQRIISRFDVIVTAGDETFGADLEGPALAAPPPVINPDNLTPTEKMLERSRGILELADIYLA